MLETPSSPTLINGQKHENNTYYNRYYLKRRPVMGRRVWAFFTACPNKGGGFCVEGVYLQRGYLFWVAGSR
jgi:hypothetical protein